MKEWFKAIVILPSNVIIFIPCLLLYFCKFHYTIPAFWQILLGIICFIFGITMFIWTIKLFCEIGKGTLAPWAPTKHLITSGPYNITRNPMVTGVLFILLAESLILNSKILLIWMLTFFVINNIYFRLFEEKVLERKFGDEYLEYKKHVPMWFPKFKSF